MTAKSITIYFKNEEVLKPETYQSILDILIKDDMLIVIQETCETRWSQCILLHAIRKYTIEWDKEYDKTNAGSDNQE